MLECGSSSAAGSNKRSGLDLFGSYNLIKKLPEVFEVLKGDFLDYGVKLFISFISFV